MKPEKQVRAGRSTVILGERFTLVTGILLVSVFAGGGAVRVWDGSHSGYWSNPQNWSGNVAPQTGDDLVFPSGAANLVNTNDLTGLTFGSITVSGSNYIFRASGSGQLQLTGGISAQHSAGFCIIAQPVRIRAAQTWECTTAGARLEMSADLALDLGSYTLTVAGQGRVELGAVITGTGGLIKNGGGTLRLGGSVDNTYTGLTRVNAGLVELAKSGLILARAIPGQLIIEDGATVRLLNHNQIWAQNSRATVTVRGTGVLDLNGYRESLAEMFLEGGRLTLGSSGALTLLSNVTASGGATISGSPGLVDLGGQARTFTVTDTLAGDDLWISASVGGTGSLSKQGTGQMLLSQSNWYSGVTVVAEGTLAVSHDYALGGGAATMVRSNATLELRGNWLVPLSLREPLWLNGSGAGGLGALRACNTFSGATAFLSCEASVELTTDAVIRIEDRTSLRLKGALSGNGGFTKTGPGELALQSASANTYQGDTVVVEGTLGLGCGTIGGAIPGATLIIGDGMGGGAADVVRLDGGNQIAPQTEIRVRSSGLLDLNGYNQTLFGLLEILNGEVRTGTGRLALGPNSWVRAESTALSGGSIQGQLYLGSGTEVRRFEMLPGTWSPALRIYASVSGEAGVEFYKTGLGSLDLLASNSFGGHLRVCQGNVYVANNYALGTTNGGTTVSNGASLILDAVAIPAEPIILQGAGASQYGALWSGNGLQASLAGPITLAADTVIGVVGTNGQLTLSGPITGPGGLKKVGEGTLVFSGGSANNYAGDTWVQEGALRLAKSAGAKAIWNGQLIVGDGLGGPLADRVVWQANHQVDGYMSFPFPSYYGRIPVVINSSGFLDLNGFVDHVLGLTMHAGRVDTGEGTLVLDGDVTADSTSTNMALIEGRLQLRPERLGVAYFLRKFDVVGTNSLLSVRAQMSSPQAGVWKTGTGFLGLSGSNSYGLDTIISNGVLSITHPYALGTTNAGTVVHQGASLALGGFGVQVAGEALLLAGDGFAGRGALATETLAVSNSWSGPVILSNDTRIAVATDTMLNLVCPISGLGGFTKTNAGRLRLSGSVSNSYAGTTRVQGGTLELAKGVGALNGAVPGRLEIVSGTVRLLGSTQIANAADVGIDSGGVLDLNNMGEAFDELSGSGTVQLGSGYLNVGTDNGSSTFAGRITGSGDLTKFGTGTLRLTGDNPYTGATTVREGTLIVNGTQSGSAVTVQAGATLRGVGWVGPLTVYGRVAPGGAGAVPGTLLCGNLLFSSSGRLASTLFADGCDQLRVLGTVQLGNATLELTRQTAPWLGQRFWLIDNDGTDAVSGTFAGLPEGATVVLDGLPLQLSYRGGSSNDVMLTFTNPPLEITGVQIGWGDGDSVLEPGECSLLEVLLTNRTGATVRQIQASLLPGAPGSGNSPVDSLWLPHSQSPYPDIVGGGTGTNLNPFQLWLGTWWPSGQDVRLSLRLETATNGAFVLPLTLPTGAAGGALGGGPCELCPTDFQVAALLSPNAPVQMGQLTNSVASSCGEWPMLCPGVRDLVPRCYNAYWFVNGESNACITVQLTGPRMFEWLLFSAAYLDEFNPTNICSHFLGTAGHSGNANYSFNVGPRRRFVVVVSQAQTNALPQPVGYTLRVSGGSCRPWLEIERPSAKAVAVKWTTAAVEHQLEATPALSSPVFTPVTNRPVVIAGKCVVTNQHTGQSQFYRLRAEQ